MNSLAWIVLSAIIVFTLIPLFDQKYRTRSEIIKASATVVIVLAIMIAVQFFHVNYLIAVVIGFTAMILFDKKTYTKKRLIIYGSILLIIGVSGYIVLRDNPDYVLDHLENNPETSSLYVAENGEEIISYQADLVRPLASTVKMLLAVEYAIQVDEGVLDKEEAVLLSDLEKHYLKGSDGNAHENWLAMMQEEGKTKEGQVTLHDVAKGMITFSSNANTDYLMDELGIDSINQRAEELELTSHEELYPIVAALFISDHVEQAELESMSMDEYRDRAKVINQQLQDGSMDISKDTLDMSMDLQRIWSDRLIGASAADYGKLLAIISNDELPAGANEIARDILEWPMEINNGNKERFAHLGSKGGSTAFILNDAMYAEDHHGEKIEFVILMDDLNLWQQFQLNRNLNSFESEVLASEAYRLEIQEILTK